MSTGKEEASVRRKKLGMRSWRRGTKEMDLILGPYSDSMLATLSPAQLDAYEALLQENDQDLYTWITGQATAPETHRATIGAVQAFHDI